MNRATILGARRENNAVTICVLIEDRNGYTRRGAAILSADEAGALADRILDVAEGIEA